MFLWNRKKMNYEDRPNGVKPSILLMHYTGMETMEAARERLSSPDSTVSAHYLVDEDGTIFDLVSEEKRAWHAGVSFWAGETDINSYSIGVEIVNPGHEWGYKAFPDVQMEAVKDLSCDIMGRHQIENVLGHSDVAPERKIDPGELFDWQYLSSCGVGLWPVPTQEEYAMAERVAMNDFEVEKLFIAFGYNPMAAYADVVTAFHRHYYPERFSDDAQAEVCVETVARLLSLLHMSEAQLFEKD